MGYGFSVNKDPLAENPEIIIDTFGWAGAFNTWFTINTTDNIVAIIMSQVLFNPYEQELVSNFRKAVLCSVARQ